MRTLRLLPTLFLCGQVAIVEGNDDAVAHHQRAIALAREKNFLEARSAADRAVEIDPEWAEARFVRAGILTKLARSYFDAKQPVRRGVDYASAASAFAQAQSDLDRYLSLEPWAENRVTVEEAARQLRELAEIASRHAATIAAWDAHEYPIRAWVKCRAEPYDRYWFEVAGRAVQSLRAGEHQVLLRTQDCGTEVRTITMPLYEGGPERYVEMSFVREPPGPAQERLDASLAVAAELLHASSLTLLHGTESAGMFGARFDGGSDLVGATIRLTGRDRGGWRWRAALQAQLGYYRGSARVATFSPAPGEPNVSGTVDLDVLRIGFGLRIHRAWHAMRAFASVGVANDRWRIAQPDVEAVGSWRTPLAIGIERIGRCNWQYGARLQYSPALPTESLNTFSTLDVSAAVSRAWCGSGRGVTTEGIRRAAKSGPAARRSIATIGLGLDRVSTDATFGLRHELSTGDQYGAEFDGAVTVTGPTLQLRVLDSGSLVRASFGLSFGYYSGEALMTSYVPRPDSGDPSVSGLPRDVGVHVYQFAPTASLRLPAMWVSPFVSIALGTEVWNSSEGDNPPVTAFRVPLSAGIEILPTCALRFGVHARYSPGTVVGIQENFTTSQVGATISYGMCAR